MMEMVEEDNKIKLEIKEEVEDYEEDQDYKEGDYSLVTYVKEECKPKINNLGDNVTSSGSTSQSFCSEDEDSLDIKNKVDIDIKDSKRDPFSWCIKKGVFKTVKKDTYCYDSEDKKSAGKSKETFQKNSSENEDVYSDANTDEIQSMDFDSQEHSNIIPPSTANTKKKYFKPLKYICQYCGKRFPQSDILKNHIMVHTGQRLYECDFCCERFRLKTALNRHLQSHTEKLHPCTKCGQRFATNHNLQIHLSIHENKKTFKCSLCSTAFNTRLGVYKHINQIHSKKKEVVGERTIPKNSKLDMEGNTIHEPVRKYECDECKKTFITKDGLREHILYMHMNGKKYNCKICGIKSRTRHCSDHDKRKVDLLSFTCAVCKLIFKEKHIFNKHIKNVHPSNKPYGCSFCNDSFKENYNLKAHIEVHHCTNKVKNFVCDICSMGFYRETYLNRHYKIHSQSDRTFICDVCHIKCRSKTDIRRHLVTHFGGGDKPHQCESCEKSFLKPGQLVRHRVVHTGERQYKCHLCDKAYKDDGSLKYHLNRHVGKIFTCDSCGFCSTNEHSFKRHLRQMICHKKTFTCAVCKKVLKSEKFLKNHMRRIHSENE